ncbi:hypothetical protein RCL1_004278 [Eukaryota sp. TZLM3-RCL]
MTSATPTLETFDWETFKNQSDFDIWSKKLAELQTDSSSPVHSEHESFEALPIPEHVRSLLEGMCYNRPSKIQAETIAECLSENPPHIIASAPGGTGKTSGFVLSCVSKIDSASETPLQVIYTAATKEALDLVCDMFNFFSQHSDPLIKYYTSIQHREETPMLTKNPAEAHVIISSPMSIPKIIKEHNLSLDALKMFVVDDASITFKVCENYTKNPGNVENGEGEVEVMENPLTVLKQMIPSTCQICTCSVYYSEATMALVDQFVPSEHRKLMTTPKEQQLSSSVLHVAIDELDEKTRYQQVVELVKSASKYGAVIVFAPRNVNSYQIRNLHKQLTQEGISCGRYDSGQRTEERVRNVKKFSVGEVRVMLSTIILACGIDIPDLCLVINMDTPLIIPEQGEPIPDFETYLYKSTRCGRFGQRGLVVNYTWDEYSRQAMKAFSMESKVPIRWTGVQNLMEKLK